MASEVEETAEFDGSEDGDGSTDAREVLKVVVGWYFNVPSLFLSQPLIVVRRILTHITPRESHSVAMDEAVALCAKSGQE